MIIILNIIGWASLGYLLVVAEPAIMLKRYFGFREEDYEEMKPSVRFFHRLLYCSKCFTFWLVLICTLNVFMAAICSVLAGYIEKMLW